MQELKSAMISEYLEGFLSWFADLEMVYFVRVSTLNGFLLLACRLEKGVPCSHADLKGVYLFACWPINGPINWGVKSLIWCWTFLWRQCTWKCVFQSKSAVNFLNNNFNVIIFCSQHWKFSLALEMIYF